MGHADQEKQNKDRGEPKSQRRREKGTTYFPQRSIKREAQPGSGNEQNIIAFISRSLSVDIVASDPKIRKTQETRSNE